MELKTFFWKTSKSVNFEDSVVRAVFKDGVRDEEGHQILQVILQVACSHH